VKEPERSGCHSRAITRLFNETSGKKIKPKT